jgi:hypothetical protein
MKNPKVITKISEVNLGGVGGRNNFKKIYVKQNRSLGNRILF